MKPKNLALLVLSFVLAIPYVIPFYWMVLASFRDAAMSQQPILYPFIQTLSNYVYVIKTSGFLTWYANSLLISVVTTTLSVFISALSGYAFSRISFAL